MRSRFCEMTLPPMPSPSNVVIVIPTYNERETLPVLVARIRALSLQSYRMLVVDDNSPDGTGALADELAREYPLSVIHRQKKEGLGKAYVHAFTDMLLLPPDKQPRFVIQMDADLSHDPADIPRLLEATGSCDVVLGSRYVRGGRIERWDFFRRSISRFGNVYARMLLHLPFRDLTGGYKCFRFEVLKSLNLHGISSTGYNFQIETTYFAHRTGFRICEIPIVFTERTSGASKFNLAIVLESFWKVFTLRFAPVSKHTPETPRHHADS